MRYPYTKKVTTPAGTTQAVPLMTKWPLDEGTLLYLEVIIPSGHAGLTGLMVQNQGTQYVPWLGSDWLVGDDRTVIVELDTPVAQSGLMIVTYNTGFYPHSHYLRCLIDQGANSGADTTSGDYGALQLSNLGGV